MRTLLIIQITQNKLRVSALKMYQLKYMISRHDLRDTIKLNLFSSNQRRQIES